MPRATSYVPLALQLGAQGNPGLTVNTKFCIFSQMIDPKTINFRGTSLEDLRTFPLSARREAGYQLDQVQHGQQPDDWKPMPGIGQGVIEIRIRDAAGAFRVIYVAKFANAVDVLHCFQKKHRRRASRIWSWPNAVTATY